MSAGVKFLTYMVYFGSVLLGGAWSVSLLINAEDSAGIQASMAPIVIGYLIAEGFFKAMRELSDS